MELNAAAWRGRPVLVTGHTGFKGSWLCWWLKALGAEVSGIALEPPTRPSLFEASGLGTEMRSHLQDVRDAERFAALVRSERPAIIFHLAAQSLVREGYRQPAATFATNVMGTVNCLEAARGCEGVRAIVVVTSDKCYEEVPSARPYREADPLGGHDPYAASKAAAEIATQAYRRSFFEQGAALVASARAGNVIGGGDWATDRLVPDAVRAFAAGKPLSVRNPRATRPWQHVLEPLRGYLMLGERLLAQDRSAAAAWNFGPAEEDTRPVSWVADRLVASWGEGAHWTPDGAAHPREAPQLQLDSGKAVRELGWRPVLRLEPALEWVAAWHRAVASGRSAKAVTLEQIEDYRMRCAA
jgi:CDP-glucose 4,6-dehydratase